jgi:hypothetical protein
MDWPIRDVICISAASGGWPRLLSDILGNVYLAPNCYCVVDLRTGITLNRPAGLTSFDGVVTLVWVGEAAE